MNKNGNFRNGFKYGIGYDSRNNVQYHIWNKGGKVEFADNEGKSFNIVLDFEVVEKLYKEMLTLRG